MGGEWCVCVKDIGGCRIASVCLGMFISVKMRSGGPMT